MIGDHREFQIIGGEDENGQVKLSIRRLEFARAWERVRQIQAEDCTIRAEILSINRGGALVNFEGLRGFLPGRSTPSSRLRPTRSFSTEVWLLNPKACRGCARP